jgi:putative tricarboxylic transport membrane protein
MTPWLISLLAAGALGTAVHAQPAPYPAKRIDLIVAAGAGGGLDLVGRALEQALRETRAVDQPLVIVNMGGGAGNTAKSYVHQHQGDPYLLYLDTNRIYLNKLVGTTPLGHDAVTPVARLMTEYLVWAVRADSPYKTAKDLLDKLRADPGAVTFGIASLPSNDQINVIAPALALGIDARKLRIAAFSTAMNSQLLGGHVGALSTPLSEVLPLVKTGQVRLLAVSAPERLAGDLAAVPTWRSLGMDVVILHWRGIFAPPGMPPEALKFWQDRLSRLVKTEAWQKTLERHGWYDAYAGAAVFQKALDQELALYTRILGDLNMLKSAP